MFIETDGQALLACSLDIAILPSNPEVLNRITLGLLALLRDTMELI